MALPVALLDKVRLLLVRERELLGVRQELEVHRAWMLRVQRIVASTHGAASVHEAWGWIVRELVHASPYEFAAVLPDTEAPVTHGIADPPGVLAQIAEVRAAWADGVAVVLPPSPGEHEPSWLLGGQVRGITAAARALVVVGRTPRTAGYYAAPWDIDRDHLGYLLETLAHAVAAVEFRAELTAERNDLQRKVDDATRSLRLALDDARTARETAEAASRAKSVFLANMSHELRTPLNAIIGYSELLAAETEDAGMVQDLERIRASGSHLLALISDILDLTKIEAGRMEIKVSTFDLGALVRSVCAALDTLAGSRGNHLEARTPATEVIVASDERKVRQILVNLVGNACKFTDGGEIVVSLDATEDEVQLDVADTGIGMGPRLLARLFEPFHREEASVEGRPAGSGLGLAICRQFCVLLDGRITAHSELGRGSRFEVRLPRRLTVVGGG